MILKLPLKFHKIARVFHRQFLAMFKIRNITNILFMNHVQQKYSYSAFRTNARTSQNLKNWYFSEEAK